MMEIRLTDEYRITGEPRNIVLEQLITPRSSEDGQVKDPYWKPVGYYGKLEHALNAVLDRKIEGAPVRDIQELKQFVAGVRDELVRAVKERGQA